MPRREPAKFLAVAVEQDILSKSQAKKIYDVHQQGRKIMTGTRPSMCGEVAVRLGIIDHNTVNKVLDIQTRYLIDDIEVSDPIHSPAGS